MGALICWKLKNNHFKKIKYLSPSISVSFLSLSLTDTFGKYLYSAIFKIKHLEFKLFSRQENYNCSLFYHHHLHFQMYAQQNTPLVRIRHHPSQENKRVNYFVLSSSLDSYFLMVLQEETTKTAILFSWKTSNYQKSVILRL